VSIAERDYQCGQGVLHLRITVVDRAHPVQSDGEAWLWVEGIQVSSVTGDDIRPRRVLVRARGLPRSR
jgi:hypothetical protein